EAVGEREPWRRRDEKGDVLGLMAGELDRAGHRCRVDVKRFLLALSRWPERLPRVALHDARLLGLGDGGVHPGLAVAPHLGLAVHHGPLTPHVCEQRPGELRVIASLPGALGADLSVRG